MSPDIPAHVVIAVIGLAGTGKSSAVEILADELEAPVVYFGGVVIDEVGKRGLQVNERNERAVRESLRQELGMGAIAITALPSIEKLLQGHRIVLLDGLYSSAEVEVLDNSLTHPLITVAIHTSRHVREARMMSRKVRPLTPEQLLSRDRSEIRLLDKAEPIAMADIHILNDGSKAELLQELISKVVNAGEVLGKYKPGHH